MHNFNLLEVTAFCVLEIVESVVCHGKGTIQMSSAKNGNLLQMPARADSSLGVRAADVMKESDSVESVFGDTWGSGAQPAEQGEPGLVPESAARDITIEQLPTKGAIEDGFAFIAVDRVRFSPYQTREVGGEEELEELARSIESRGVLQPILVRPCGEDDSVWEYELIAGERRLRAARMVGLAFVPAMVQSLGDVDAAQNSIIENAQRENLNPIEEARAFAQLQSDFKLNQTEIARAIGKNRATISNALRLLQLDEHVIEMLRLKQLSAGHGRALLRLDEPSMQIRFAKKVAEADISVHALDERITKYLEDVEEEELSEEELREIKALERQENKVSDLLGLEEVRLRYDAEGNRRLNIVFETEASWKRFMSKLRA